MFCSRNFAQDAAMMPIERLAVKVSTLSASNPSLKVECKVCVKDLRKHRAVDGTQTGYKNLTNAIMD